MNPQPIPDHFGINKPLPLIIPDTVYPNKIIKYDPTSAFAMVCKFCEDCFMANNMNRRFCPSKYGITNYCKNKWKELQAESRLVDNAPLIVYRQ